MSTLRVAHVSDTHIGYRTYRDLDPRSRRNQRAVDFERAWEDAVSQIIKADPDLVIHSGDVFHYPRPDWRSIQVFIQGMKRLVRAGLPVVVIGGNHDTPRLRTNGSVFTVCEAAVPEASWVCGYEEQTVMPRPDTVVHCVPYGYLHGSKTIRALVHRAEWNLMAVHGTVVGQLTPAKFTHGEPDTEYVDDVFDYVALGHHHLHYRAKGVSYYAGSTERCGFSDEHSAPGWALVTLEKGRPPGVEHRPVVSRSMITLDPILNLGTNQKSVDVVAGWILDQVDDYGEPDGLFRSELCEAERGMVRRVQQAVDRKLNGCAWKVVVFAKSEVGFGDIERIASTSSENLSILELFEEYVTSRDYTAPGYPPEFRESFAAKGRQALESAVRAEQERSGDA